MILEVPEAYSELVFLGKPLTVVSAEVTEVGDSALKRRGRKQAGRVRDRDDDVTILTSCQKGGRTQLEVENT